MEKKITVTIIKVYKKDEQRKGTLWHLMNERKLRA